eukprot:comp17736_c1_seq1/m.17690 comp17736_c1_seq1/g.17690  ORF comp17736_c1_seq1/g.17690 comp17736_c1_seq1/m.17690 type:complete len:500 (-) comp17736_c1_seq1:264-1763(-)
MCQGSVAPSLGTRASSGTKERRELDTRPSPMSGQTPAPAPYPREKRSSPATSPTDGYPYAYPHPTLVSSAQPPHHFVGNVVNVAPALNQQPAHVHSASQIMVNGSTALPPNKRFCPQAPTVTAASDGEGRKSPPPANDDVVGRRVFARGRDGAMFPGIIKAVRYCRTNAIIYCIQYDDGSTGEVFGRDIIGEGFRQLAHTRLHLGPGMRVYVTYNRMLCQGRILSMHEDKNQAVVELDDGDKIRCSIDDVHTEQHSGPEESQSVRSGSPVGIAPPAIMMQYPPAPGPHPPAPSNPQGRMSLVIGGPLTRSAYTRTDSGISSAGHISPAMPFPDHSQDNSLDSNSSHMTTTYPTPHPPPPTSWVTADGHLAAPGSGTSSDAGRGRRFVYRCMYPDCGHSLATMTGIRRHVRQAHFGEQAPVAMVDRYIMQQQGVSYPSTRSFQQPQQDASPPEISQEDSGSREWVKCRKKFGAERKDLWCTKCRWKKACERVPVYDLESQ